MRQEWSPDELVGAWTLVEGDWRLLGNKSGVTRLGFALLLKFFELEGRFPAYPEEIPAVAVEYVAGLVKVDPALFTKYSWSARAIKYHRAQIRDSFGFREATRADEQLLAAWLAGRCAGSSWSRTAWSRRCWRIAGRSGSSRRAGWSESLHRPEPSSMPGCVPGRWTGSAPRRQVWRDWSRARTTRTVPGRACWPS